MRSELMSLVAALANAVAETEEKQFPKYRFDGELITTAEEVAAALGISVIEAKARIRRVRTQAGVRKYGQPIGSIITEDLLPQADIKFVPGKPSYWKRDSTHSLPYYNLIHDDRFEGTITKQDRSGARFVLEVRDKKDGITHVERAYTFESAKKLFENWRDKKLMSENIRRTKPVSKKRFVSNKDAYWGVYGRDWSYGDENESDLPEWDEDMPSTRMAWAKREVENLGIKWEGVYLNPKFFEVANRVLEHHEEQYPGFSSLVTKVGTSTSMPSAYAYNKIEFPRDKNEAIDYNGKKTSSVYWNGLMFAGEKGQGTLMGYNMPEHGQEGNQYKSYRYEDMKRSYPEYTDAQRGFMRTTVHELGHTVFRIVLGEFQSREEERDEENRNYYRQMFWWDASTIMENHGLGNAEDIYNIMAYESGNNAQAMTLQMSVMRQVLSEYGGSSLHEMAAEIWAEYQLDSNPRQFAAEMGALLEQVLDEYLYWNSGE